MASTILFAFACVFVMALLFMVLMVVRRSKYFTPIWATLSMVCWFAMGGLQFMAFDVSVSILSFLWYAIGAVTEVTGIVLTLLTLKADSEENEMTL